MKLFRKILVPADLTDRNREAVALALELVRPSGGKIHLLHVIEIIPGFSLEEEKDFYDRLEAAATKHLAQLARPIQAEKVAFEAEVAYGPRAKTILDEADRIEADLIVIQSHRLDPERPHQGFGSLSYQIGIFAQTPVLLVK